MKKILLLSLLVIFIMTSCSPKKENKPTVNIGDSYLGGIVIQVDPNGTSGLVMSTIDLNDGNPANWTDAWSICVNYGPHWRMPSPNEFDEGYTSFNVPSNTLYGKHYWTYFSGSITNTYTTWYFSNGQVTKDINTSDKLLYVRAVKDF